MPDIRKPNKISLVLTTPFFAIKLQVAVSEDHAKGKSTKPPIFFKVAVR